MSGNWITVPNINYDGVKQGRDINTKDETWDNFRAKELEDRKQPPSIQTVKRKTVKRGQFDVSEVIKSFNEKKNKI